jgi:hypothetical protein
MTIELYNILNQDPDSYWILYDLCLENNWCFADTHYIPYWLYINYNRRRSIAGRESVSRKNGFAASYSGDLMGGYRSFSSNISK